MQEVTREGGGRLLEVSSVEHVRLQVVAGEGGGAAADEPASDAADAPRTDDIMVSDGLESTVGDTGNSGYTTCQQVARVLSVSADVALAQ